MRSFESNLGQYDKRLLMRKYPWAILAAVAVAMTLYYAALTGLLLSLLAKWILFGVLVMSLVAQLSFAYFSDLPDEAQAQITAIAVMFVSVILAFLGPIGMLIHLLLLPIVVSAVVLCILFGGSGSSGSDIRNIFIVGDVRELAAVLFFVLLAVCVLCIIVGIVLVLSHPNMRGEVAGLYILGILGLAGGNMFFAFGLLLECQWCMQVGFVIMSLLYGVGTYCAFDWSLKGGEIPVSREDIFSCGSRSYKLEQMPDPVGRPRNEIKYYEEEGRVGPGMSNFETEGVS